MGDGARDLDAEQTCDTEQEAKDACDGASPGKDLAVPLASFEEDGHLGQFTIYDDARSQEQG